MHVFNLTCLTEKTMVITSCKLKELILQLCSFNEYIFKERYDGCLIKNILLSICINVNNTLIFPVLSLYIGF